MADSVFDLVADELERCTDLARLEARGTVRLALRQSGLDARSVTSDQMTVVLRRVMPNEMRCRGIDGADELCERIVASLQGSETAEAPAAESPEAIFRRLAEG